MPASKIVYSTKATATGGGRDGTSKTHDGALDLKMAPPTEMGGSGDGVNPEQLFAAGYAACFLGAMRAYARGKKIDVPSDAAVTATVGIGPRDDNGFDIAVEIDVSLPGLPDDVADDLIAGGHHVCPYSDATRGSLTITPRRAS